MPLHGYRIQKWIRHRYIRKRHNFFRFASILINMYNIAWIIFLLEYVRNRSIRKKNRIFWFNSVEFFFFQNQITIFLKKIIYIKVMFMVKFGGIFVSICMHVYLNYWPPFHSTIAVSQLIRILFLSCYLYEMFIKLLEDQKVSIKRHFKKNLIIIITYDLLSSTHSHAAAFLEVFIFTFLEDLYKQKSE